MSDTSNEIIPLTIVERLERLEKFTISISANIRNFSDAVEKSIEQLNHFPDAITYDDSNNEKHLYCERCKENFLSFGGDLGEHEGHTCRRFCCNSSVYNGHRIWCPTRQASERGNIEDKSNHHEADSEYKHFVGPPKVD